MENIDFEVLAETDNFRIYYTRDEDTQEIYYHLDTATVTCHFLPEEWTELLELFRVATQTDGPQESS
ncbi:MAG: hypothetical protein EXR62_05820 [Chloroflexi bacterium]|nr:hypothetical protein [Chloroflexota bacterium]